MEKINYVLDLDIPQIVYYITMFLLPMGIGACIMNIIQTANSDFPKKSRKLFNLMFASVITYLTMHYLRTIFLSFRWQFISTIVPIFVFLEFLSSGFIVYFISLFLIDIASPRRKKQISVIFTILLSVNIILLVISQFNHMYYHFTVEPLIDEIYFVSYHRSEMYLLSNLCPALMLAGNVFLFSKYHKRFDRHFAVAFWIYILLPVAAIILQATYIFEAQFIVWSTVIGTIILFSAIIRKSTKDYEIQKSEKTRLDTELSTASDIQNNILPNIFPAFPDRHEFDIYASMTPAKEIGGDFYDFFLTDDDHLAMVIADVSGKGIPAALFMMASKTIIKSCVLSGASPAQALKSANIQICQNNREEMFVTVWLGILELSTGTLKACNAGHEYPALMQPGSHFDLYKDKHGLMIGYMESAKFIEYEIKLKKGSKLFLYTDGVAEATDTNGKLFNTDRMVMALTEAKEKNPEEILKAVNNAVGKFIQDAPQFDDLTMLCLEYKGKEKI